MSLSVCPEQSQNPVLASRLREASFSPGDEAVVLFEGAGIHEPDYLTDVLQVAFCPLKTVAIRVGSHRVGVHDCSAEEIDALESCFDADSCRLLRKLQGRQGFALFESRVCWDGDVICLASTKLRNFKPFSGQVNKAESYLESGIVLVS